jgi:hypothetical protein
VSSMTFASGEPHLRTCDCDECGLVEIPAPILAAMQRKRQKMSLRRTQERSLVCREHGIAVWKLTMPVNAEPLVEFGSSHRLVWMQRMVGGNKLQSIGTGIIGSSAEEKSRRDLDWSEGSMYLVPSNGGKAMGWIHTTNKNSSSSENDDEDKPGGHAIMQIVKVPADKLLSTDGDDSENTEDDEENWVSVFLRLCLTGFLEIADSTNEKPPYYKFSEEDCSALREAFRKAAEEKNDSLPAQSSASVPIVPQPKPNGNGTVFNPSG